MLHASNMQSSTVSSGRSSGTLNTTEFLWTTAHLRSSAATESKEWQAVSWLWGLVSFPVSKILTSRDNRDMITSIDWAWFWKGNDLSFKVSSPVAGYAAYVNESHRAGGNSVRELTAGSTTCRNQTLVSFSLCWSWNACWKFVHFCMSIYFHYDRNVGAVQREDVCGKGGGILGGQYLVYVDIRTMAFRRSKVIC